MKHLKVIAPFLNLYLLLLEFSVVQAHVFTEKDCHEGTEIARDIGDFCNPLATVYHYFHSTRSCDIWPWNTCRLKSNKFNSLDECRSIAQYLCKPKEPLPIQQNRQKTALLKLESHRICLEDSTI
ncbi:hypothetical protein ILUMI_11268 [Ignelater luminosus]|uniref:BPTI/Kunitz inhibitor domain-containing protein n=1 Tax=Ignelater luminosus TaxID=2038154 RepID=A0A8K0D2F3_IGNLU|nr:hypothetical protein ILUMI_11268 [Ignelater luminosus]